MSLKISFPFQIILFVGFTGSILLLETSQQLTKKGVFDIRSFYNKLRSSLPITFPWKGIWKAKAPTHVSFFIWTAAWEKILTGDILRYRGFDFVDWCILCRCNGESVNHLLLHCDKAYLLWSMVFRSFGISWVLPRSVADMLLGWWSWFGKRSSGVWNLAPLCLMWCIWRERNWRTVLSRIGTSLMTSCSLTLVALFLIGLGLGDSPLVILSLCSLVLFSVINLLLVVSVCFLFLLLFFVCFPSLYSLFCLVFS